MSNDEKTYHRELLGKLSRAAWETVTRIAHYALVTEDARRVCRFYLTTDGTVADFDWERR